MNIHGTHYHIETNGSGSPLLLLHDFTGSSQSWQHLMPALSAHHQVIRVDLMGHGQTESPQDVRRYSFKSIRRDFIAIIHAVAQQPVHVLGYSMGGRLALYLAVNHPVLFKSLILESASPGLATQAERDTRKHSDDALADRIERDGLPAFVDEWENLPLWHTQSPEQKQALRQQRLKNHPHGLANSLRGYGTGVQPSLWEKLSSVALPTMVIAGEQDKKFVQIAEEMHQKFTQSHKVIIPQAGHTTHLENSSVFSQVVLEFLANHE